jgi:lysylphosphatidylglycerol synthetase-like protein (DUF2156 family)
MNTTTRKPSIAHRIGRAIRRGWDKLNQFELGVARRAGKAFPAFGFWTTRILFLILKLAMLAVLAFIAVQLLFLAFLFLVFVLMSRQRVEVTNWDENEDYVPDWDDVFDPAHQAFWGDHPVYHDHND